MNASVQNRADRFEDSGSVTATPWPPVRQTAFAPIEFIELSSEYHIIVPLLGIDARNVYVFAMPYSILIETRLRRVKHHKTIETIVTERTNQRIETELNLPAEIEQGTTTIHVCADSLLITTRKAHQSKGTSWSQLIHFDTKVASPAV